MSHTHPNLDSYIAEHRVDRMVCCWLFRGSWNKRQPRNCPHHAAHQVTPLTSPSTMGTPAHLSGWGQNSVNGRQRGCPSGRRANEGGGIGRGCAHLEAVIERESLFDLGNRERIVVAKRELVVIVVVPQAHLLAGLRHPCLKT